MSNGEYCDCKYDCGGDLCKCPEAMACCGKLHFFYRSYFSDISVNGFQHFAPDSIHLKIFLKKKAAPPGANQVV